MTVRALHRVGNFTEPPPSPGKVEAQANGLAVTIHQLRKSFGQNQVLRESICTSVPASS